MPNSRQSKWKWDPHLQRMRDLYNSGLTIPQIHKAIQCDSFRPCQRVVYHKFKAMGYRTDHDRGLRHCHAGSPGDVEANGTPTYQQPLPMSMLDHNVPRAAICVPIEDETHTAGTRGSVAHAISMAYRGFDREDNDGYYPLLLIQGQVADENFATRKTLDSARHPEKEIVNDVTLGIPPGSPAITNKPRPSDSLPSEESQIGRSQQRKRRNSSNTPGQEVIIQNLRDAGILPHPQHSGGRTKHSYRVKEISDRATDLHEFQKSSKRLDSQGGWQGKDPATIPSHADRMRRIRSLFDIGNSHSKVRARQESPFADNDSGYRSGTPSTLHSRDSLTLHPESLSEFQGLYRVACHTLHEPKPPNLYGEIQACDFCGYSSIHNLAWSANHFMLQKFEAELESKSLDDIQVLDAAGNSALHYAAISGASYAHLKALIDAGVPLYQRNTANQIFLHCLNPGDAAAKSCSVDCFKLGLISLLQLIEPKLAFGQQDNDGQTVLHVLASHITVPEIRARTFEFFSNAGFPPVVLNRFGKSAKDVRSSTYQYGQTMFAAETFNTISTSPPDLEPSGMSEWEDNILKQMNANNILVEAHNNPYCVDSKTKDTILHALSRLNVQSGGSMQSHDIIRYLRQFVAKGVNLNRHNRDGHHPLAAFICNQDFRGSETGATMAKYIDILLWKGGKRPESNDINVNMMTRSGATALYEAAVHAQSDSVRSLIEAGANVNARLNNDPRGLSILQATIAARNKAVVDGKDILHHDFKNIISHLEHAGAVPQPTSLEERGRPT